MGRRRLAHIENEYLAIPATPMSKEGEQELREQAQARLANRMSRPARRWLLNHFLTDPEMKDLTWPAVTQRPARRPPPTRGTVSSPTWTGRCGARDPLPRSRRPENETPCLERRTLPQPDGTPLTPVSPCLALP